MHHLHIHSLRFLLFANQSSVFFVRFLAAAAGPSSSQNSHHQTPQDAERLKFPLHRNKTMNVDGDVDEICRRFDVLPSLSSRTLIYDPPESGAPCQCPVHLDAMLHMLSFHFYVFGQDSGAEGIQ
jgi:hypothetical protein